MYRLILVILIILSLNTYSQSYLGLSRFDIQSYLEKDNNDYKVKTNGSTVYILYYVNDLGIAYYFNENNVCILCLYMCQYGSMEYTSIMKQLSEKFITSIKTGVYDENCLNMDNKPINVRWMIDQSQYPQINFICYNKANSNE